MVDVAMLAWNFNEELAVLTESAIASMRQAPINQLIIIDNASSVRAGMLRDNADIYIRNKVNVGYPKAVNQGMAISETEYVAIANNDIRVSPNWVEVAEEILENPKVGSVHFRMLKYEEPFSFGNDVWVGGKERWCHSSFFVIRRAAFQGYDATYGKGGYDDYAHHQLMRSRGWMQAYTNKVSWQHMDSITYRTCEPPEERAKRDAWNKEYYKSKFGEYPDEQFAKQFGSQLLAPYFPFP
jgi:glycosyltransferase involved in cell wall biosynthesis